MTPRSPFRHGSAAGLLSMVVAATLTAAPTDGRTTVDEHPGGPRPATGAVRTVEAESEPSATGGFQGTVERLPDTLAFPFAQGAVVAGPLLRGDGVLASSPSATGIPFQRIDLPTTEAVRGVVTWEGRVDPARSVSLRAWDGRAWEPLDSSRGRADAIVTLAGTVGPRHLHDGVVPVMVTGRDPFADDVPNEVAPSFEDPDSYDVAIAHVTDTQYLAEGADASRTRRERATWRRAYTDTMDWIVENADARRIAYTAHTGDLVQNWQHARDDRARARRELVIASAAQSILDRAGLVNSVLPGNHDNQSGADTGRDALFNDFFGPGRYADLARHPRWQAARATYRPWRRGDNANGYVLFSGGGIDFVAVSLGFAVTAEEAAWADGVLERFRDRNAVLLTHAYTGASGRPDGRGGSLSYDGSRVRSRVVRPNPNVFLVLSGHEHGVDIEVRRDVGGPGNHVVELLADYQFYEVRAREVGLGGVHAPSTPLRMGSSFFRLLQLDVGRSEVSVDTYSPLLDDFGATEHDGRHRYDGTEDDFRLPVQLQHRSTSFVTDSLVLAAPADTAKAAAVTPRDR